MNYIQMQLTKFHYYNHEFKLAPICVLTIASITVCLRGDMHQSKCIMHEVIVAAVYQDTHRKAQACTDKETCMQIHGGSNLWQHSPFGCCIICIFVAILIMLITVECLQQHLA
jgi:hypothetical protein